MSENGSVNCPKCGKHDLEIVAENKWFVHYMCRYCRKYFSIALKKVARGTNCWGGK